MIRSLIKGLQTQTAVIIFTVMRKCLPCQFAIYCRMTCRVAECLFNYSGVSEVFQSLRLFFLTIFNFGFLHIIYLLVCRYIYSEK